MDDLLVIHDTGAHGYSMGYNYNGRLRSAEVLLRPMARPTSSPRRAPGDTFPRSTCCRAAESCWPSRAPKAPAVAPKTSAWQSQLNGTNASRSRSRGEEHGHPQSRGLNRRPGYAFKKDGSVDFDALERLIDFHSAKWHRRHSHPGHHRRERHDDR
ncbi:MAG: hypothetical protein ACLU37_03250 [Collinsella sp.]